MNATWDSGPFHRSTNSPSTIPQGSSSQGDAWRLLGFPLTITVAFLDHYTKLE